MNTFKLNIPEPMDVASSSPVNDTFKVNFEPKDNTLFDLNGTQVSGRLIDGDTVAYTDSYGNKGSVRFGFGDAGETAKITPDGVFSAGSYAGSTQFEEINKLAQSQGFNKIVITGDKDPYGRQVGDLENAAGQRFSEKLITENIVKPSMYLGEGVQDKQYNLVLKRGINQNMAWLNGAEKALTPWQQASEVVESVVSQSPTMIRTMADTSDELIFGSRGYSNAIKAEMKSLEKVINDPSMDKEARELAKEQYKKASEMLQVNANYDNPFYGSQQQIEEAVSRRSVAQPGTFAGWVNASKRSIVNLESSAATFNIWSGDLVNNEGWQQWGDDWASETEQKYKGINTSIDLFDIRGPGDAFKWATETAIEFSPQLALVYAGGKVGALAGTAVAPGPGTVVGAVAGSVGVGFSLAVGQIYQSMPEGEKDPHIAAGLALAVGAVDAFGLKGAGLTGKNMLTKEGKDLFVDSIMSEKGVTREIAEAQLKKHIAGTLADTGKTLQEFAQKQMLQRQGFESYVKSAVRAGGREAVTEGLQEIIAQGGVAALTSETINWTELAKDVTRNAAAGGLVGGGFDAIVQGRVTDGLDTLNDVNAIISSFSPESNKRNDLSRIEENQRQIAGGTKKSVGAVSAEVRMKAESVNTQPLNSIPLTTKQNIKKGFKGFLKDPMSAFRATDRKLNKYAFKEDGTSNNNIQTIMGLINRDPIFVGTNAHSEIDYQRGQIISKLPSLNAAFKSTGAKNTADFEKILQTDPALLTQEQNDAIQTLSQDIDGVEDMVATLMEQAGDSGLITAKQVREEGALLTANAFDSKTIDESFITSLIGQPARVGTGNVPPIIINREFATTLAEGIKNGNSQLQDIAMLRSTPLAQTKAFRDKYETKNTLAAIINTADRLISDSVLTDRFGRDGTSIAYLLDQAKVEGEIDENTYNELVEWSSNLMSIYRGTYQKVDNPYLRAVNNALITTTTLRLMDMNAFANVGEMFYGTIGLSGKDKVKYIGRATKAFLQGITADYYSVPAEIGMPYAPIDVRDLSNKEIARLVESGHVVTANDILYTEGVNTTSPFMQQTMKIFYKLNLVSAQTNAIRGARMSFALDSISKLLEKVRVDAEAGQVSDTGRWARDRLNSYGLDPDRLITAIKKYGNLDEDIVNSDAVSIPDAAFLADQIRLAQINFTDEFSARPQPGSTPAIFESEVFRPFSQFKRFLAHVTANITPNLWSNYIKTAPPGTSYNTFSSVITIVMTAYVAQAFKDTVTYGETPEWIEDEDEEFFRSATYRAINYTGFLGTPELLLEELNSIWSKGAKAAANGDNGIMATALEAAGMAPSLGVIQSDVKALNEGGERATERLVGMVPFFGSLAVTKDPLIDLLNQANK
jgi:hypothetical protein